MGKAFFCLFLGLICFDRNKWMSWACSILFFIATVFYLILGIRYWQQEKIKYHEIVGKIDGGTPAGARNVNIQQNQANL